MILTYISRCQRIFFATLITIAPAFLSVSATFGIAQETLEKSTELPLSLIPQVQRAPWAQGWWMPRHESKLREKQEMGSIELVWIGDSITHYWERAGSEVWSKYYGKYKSLNLGFSGDRTEQVLWRIENDELKDIAPKVAVVMIGTNNAGNRQEAPEDTAAGITEIVTQVRKRCPTTKILLLAIFPRGETDQSQARALNTKTNALIRVLDDGKNVFFLDIGEKFYNAEGSLKKEFMPDYLHPNARGYEVWAEAMDPLLKQLLGQ